MKRGQQIIDAHQKYVDWWLPIDVAAGSIMAPMGLWYFCKKCLTGPDEYYIDRWFGDIVDYEKYKYEYREEILKLYSMHMLEYIDLHSEEPLKELK